MRDQPLAVVLVETKRCAPPHVELSSACLRSVNMAEPEGEGHIIARTDAEVANLIAEWTPETKRTTPARVLRHQIRNTAAGLRRRTTEYPARCWT